MTPKEKVNEYLAEFSIEKALDLAETMLDCTPRLGSRHEKTFWLAVIELLNNKKEMNDE